MAIVCTSFQGRSQLWWLVPSGQVRVLPRWCAVLRHLPDNESPMFARRSLFIISCGCTALCSALQHVGFIANGAMRLQDNPALSQFLACRTEQSAAYFVPDNNDDMTRKWDALNSFQDRMSGRKVDFHILCGDPQTDLDMLQRHNIAKIIHTDRLSCAAASLVALIKSRGHIESAQVEDLLVRVPAGTALFSQELYTPRNVQPIIPNSFDTDSVETSTGEERALQLVREYLTVGEVRFSRKYEHEYVQQAARSGYHAHSLCRLCSTEKRSEQFFEGEVLSGLLAPLTAQGCISLRVLYHAERAFMVSSRHASAAARVLRREPVRGDWHRHLARRTRAVESAAILAFPRWHKAYSFWRGYQQRQAYFRSNQDITNGISKPVLLLLHGFGGSIDQHTALAELLCDHFEVHAIDSLGFGGSEKPPLSYNQYLWSDQAVEYLENIARARRPANAEKAAPMQVVLAGNSIGGYTAATAAAAIASRMLEQAATGAPVLLNCTGLVLFNTAGVIRNNTGVVQMAAEFPPYRGLPSGVLNVAGTALTSLLRARIGPTCSWLYPTEPEYPLRSGLVNQIYRDSCDPGAAGLFAAGGKLPPPRSMNTLLAEYNGPVLVAQGALDPLNDAVGRAYALRAIRPGIHVALMRLGHCPMDEGAAEVTQEVIAWAKKNGI